jgi:hypothetical protein
MRDFLVSIPGMACVLLFKLFIASIFLCLGMQLFDTKKLAPFFTFKRLFSLFFILIGLRIFYGALHFL